MNVEQALRDPRLLGGLPAFRDLSTWAAWLTFHRAIYGLPMDATDLARFRHHTGRDQPRPGGYPEAVAIVGVQSGKSAFAATFADVAALVGAPGTYALLVGQDLRGAMRVLLRYSREPFETLDTFRAEVVRSTADTLELRNGVSLSAYPCRPAALRGLRACIVVIDELAFFTTTDGRPTDTEMLRVARGRVATTSGKLIILSSPLHQVGALYDLHRRHYGQDSSTLVWQATAPEMNPTLSTDYLTRAALDPDSYQSDVLGQFRAGITTFFDPEIIGECVDVGVRERPPSPGTLYTGYVDAASGSGKDAFAIGIAHSEGDRVVLDVLRVWKPPFNPSGPIAESSELFAHYGISKPIGDRYAAGFILEGYRSHNLTYTASERDTSANYLELLPLVNSGRVRLLDLPEPLRELRGLERKRGASGRDKVDHRHGSHDDQAVACAGALVNTAAPAPHSVQTIRVSGWGGPAPGSSSLSVRTDGYQPTPSITLDEWRANQARIEQLKSRTTGE